MIRVRLDHRSRLAGVSLFALLPPICSPTLHCKVRNASLHHLADRASASSTGSAPLARSHPPPPARARRSVLRNKPSRLIPLADLQTHVLDRICSLWLRKRLHSLREGNVRLLRHLSEEGSDQVALLFERASAACKSQVCIWLKGRWKLTESRSICQIWPIHKLVCGKRAHPFRLPGFLQEEADAVFRRITTPTSHEGNSILRQIMRDFSLFKEVLDQPDELKVRHLYTRAAQDLHPNSLHFLASQSRLNELVGHEGIPKPLNGRKFLVFGDLVTVLRSSASEWRDPSAEVGKHSLIEGFVRLERELIGDYSLDTTSQWYSLFCHHLTVEAAVNTKIHLARDIFDIKALLEYGGLGEAMLAQRLRLLEHPDVPSDARAFRMAAIEKTLALRDECVGEANAFAQQMMAARGETA